jgi:hypothetical protein
LKKDGFYLQKVNQDKCENNISYWKEIWFNFNFIKNKYFIKFLKNNILVIKPLK